VSVTDGKYSVELFKDGSERAGLTTFITRSWDKGDFRRKLVGSDLA